MTTKAESLLALDPTSAASTKHSHGYHVGVFVNANSPGPSSVFAFKRNCRGGLDLVGDYSSGGEGVWW